MTGGKKKQTNIKRTFLQKIVLGCLQEEVPFCIIGSEQKFVSEFRKQYLDIFYTDLSNHIFCSATFHHI